MLINIFDHLPKKTFVYIENDLRHILFDKCIKTTLTALSKEFSLHLKNVSRYRSGIRSVSKEFFINLVQKAKMSLSDFQDKIIIKVGKRGNKLKIGPFVNITPDWIYISELIRGDGSIIKGNNNSRRTCFSNKNKVLLSFVGNFFLRLGINKKSIGLYADFVRPDTKNLVIHSEIIAYFLNSFFQIPFGYKSGGLFVPKFIMDNKDYQLSAVRGIFDSEGCIRFKRKGGHTWKDLQICMKDKVYLENIQTILNNLGIDSSIKKEKSRKMFRLLMYKKESIIKFYQKIKPLHSHKLKIFDKLLDYYN